MMIEITKGDEMNHTPGPWTYDGKSSIDSPHGNVLSLYGAMGGLDTEADARLIAAAPELLRELKSAIFYIETYGGDVTKSFSAGGNLDAVKAIIAKAEGKE